MIKLGSILKKQIIITARGGVDMRGLPNFRATKTSTFSTNAQSRFASVVLGAVLGPPRHLPGTTDGVLISL